MHVFPAACQGLGPGCAQEPHRPGQGMCLCEATPSGWPMDVPHSLWASPCPLPVHAHPASTFLGCDLENCTVMSPGSNQREQMLQGGPHVVQTVLCRMEIKPCTGLHHRPQPLELLPCDS